jgi:hypothetical protein
MRKIVINACFGGFSLSSEAIRLFAQLSNLALEERPPLNTWTDVSFYMPDGSLFLDWTINRSDTHLVTTVEKLGTAANGPHAALKIVEIPSDVDWEIVEYDGCEHIAERHRTWS